MQKDKRRILKTILNISCQVIIGILITAVFCVYCVFRWSIKEFDFTLDSIIFTLTSPMEGTNDSMLQSGLDYCIPKVVTFVLLYFLFVSAVNIGICLTKRSYLPQVRKPLAARAKNYTALFLSVCFFFLMGFGYYTFYAADAYYDISGYLYNSSLSTTIYEDYYVNPKDAGIRFEGAKKKNLVYVYLESMETTYTSFENNGSQEVDLIPNLVGLASENTYFSHTDGFGGLYMATGATATMMALLASTAGLPFAFPTGGNSMNERENFASGVTALGDILADYGYRQMFMCGSDGGFAGREKYFSQHGNYEIYDLDVARANGDLPSADYHDGWWGFEDVYLYEIAKRQLTELSQGDAPFNFTMLTVDMHAPNGHLCEKCEDSTGTVAEAVTVCADRQFSEFMDWCKQQDFFEDTVFVISGDHLRMDKSLSTDTSVRAIYNCIIGGERPKEYRTKNRVATVMDLFPTTLYSLGFTWGGVRLGLGTNLFSEHQTLAEEMGLEALNREIEKKSLYYVANFS